MKRNLNLQFNAWHFVCLLELIVSAILFIVTGSALIWANMLVPMFVIFWLPLMFGFKRLRKLTIGGVFTLVVAVGSRSIDKLFRERRAVKAFYKTQSEIAE